MEGPGRIPEATAVRIGRTWQVTCLQVEEDRWEPGAQLPMLVHEEFPFTGLLHVRERRKTKSSICST